MISLGFSDHSFTPCDTSYCMKLEDYSKYCSEVKRLAAEYRNEIPVFLGIEKDYYSEIDRSMFDYVIASVHYIVRCNDCYAIDHTAKDQQDCRDNVFGGNMMDFVKCYYEMVAEQASVCKPDVIGHFDVIDKFSITPEESDEYIRITEEALKETFKHCKRFEINTGAISRGWRKVPYPAYHLLETLKELGGEIVINSDSHNPDNLDFYFNEAAEIAKKAGFETYSVLTPHGFEKINL
jgi:histidinol-phosphatase (PHP family)